jgi:predicted unusual protein kinase regulating ubiquinone biosynthesis (AarF/ABC1/UbiB family)
MEYLGSSVASLRSADKAIWEWSRIAYIGIQSLNILQQIHRDGITHRDYHFGNLVYSRRDPNRLHVIDLGMSKTTGRGNPASDVGYTIADIRQLVVSLRYLRDRNRVFYMAKNYSFKPDICDDAPERYCDLVKAVYTWKKVTDINYDWLKQELERIVSEDSKPMKMADNSAVTNF